MHVVRIVASYNMSMHVVRGNLENKGQKELKKKVKVLFQAE